MPVLTLTGPTCAGKSTIEAELQKLGCGRAISHTTRLPRAGEKNGEHYHFITDFEYDRLKSEGRFIETIELGTRRYAMSKAALRVALDVSPNVAIVVDPHGAEQIHEFCRVNAIPCFGVWVDCAPQEQARRWVTRMAGDMLIGKDAVGAYAERLGIMLSEEVQWRADAARGRIGGVSYDYDYTFKVWNDAEVEPRRIAESILAHAKALQA